MSAAHNHQPLEDSTSFLAELDQAFRDWDDLTAGLPHRERTQNPEDPSSGGMNSVCGAGPGA